MHLLLQLIVVCKFNEFEQNANKKKKKINNAQPAPRTDTKKKIVKFVHGIRQVQQRLMNPMENYNTKFDGKLMDVRMCVHCIHENVPTKKKKMQKKIQLCRVHDRDSKSSSTAIRFHEMIIERSNRRVLTYGL